MFVYCLFCETAKCTYIAAITEALFSCKAIRPKQIQHIVSKENQVKDITRDFLPGYVFLFFKEDPFPDILQARYIPGVFRIIGDSGEKYALSGPDAAFAEMLLERNGVFGKTWVYEENGMLHLYPSDFRNARAKILKVSRKKHRMKIQLRIADQKPTTWVEYEIIESR